jgi:ATP-dependent DNA helicase RecG
MDKAKKEFPLKQKEIITLGLLAQQSYSATELSKLLNQGEEQGLRSWLGNLLEFDLIVKTGEGKGTLYEINTKFVQQPNFEKGINKKKVQDYKLEDLIYKDITSYPNSSFGEVHKRIGQEVNKNILRWILKQMVDNNKLGVTGTNRWVKYSIARNL